MYEITHIFRAENRHGIKGLVKRCLKDGHGAVHIAIDRYVIDYIPNKRNLFIIQGIVIDKL